MSMARNCLVSLGLAVAFLVAANVQAAGLVTVQTNPELYYEFSALFVDGKTGGNGNNQADSWVKITATKSSEVHGVAFAITSAVPNAEIDKNGLLLWGFGDIFQGGETKEPQFNPPFGGMPVRRISLPDDALLPQVFNVAFAEGKFWSDFVEVLLSDSSYAAGIKPDGDFPDGGGNSWMITDGKWEGAEVPEPATLAVLGLGLAGLGVARRRMKK